MKYLKEAFIKIWGEKRYNQHLLESLKTIKINENETIEEFNKIFNDLVSCLPATIKHHATSILVHFIGYFSREIIYQLRDKDPLDIKEPQNIVDQIENNMKSSRRYNLHGFLKGSTFRSELKAKVVAVNTNE